MPVRVLGTLALVDGGETDWKVIVVDARDKSSDAMQEIEDVPEAKVSEMREWFRNYKTAEGKGVNTFGLEERAMPRKYAEKVIMETHESCAFAQLADGGENFWGRVWEMVNWVGRFKFLVDKSVLYG